MLRRASLNVLLLAAAWVWAAAEAGQPGSPSALRGTLGPRRLNEALASVGLSPEEARRASEAVSEVLNARRLRREDTFRAERAADGRLLHVTYTHGLKRVVLVPKAGGGFKAALRAVVVAENHRVSSGVVRGSLWLSMEKAGVPAEIIVAFTETFRWNVDFLTETRDGDRFSVLWTEARTDDGRLRGRRIEAGLYAGTSAGDRAAVRFEDKFYERSGESVRRRFLRAPLKFSRVSSRFSAGRKHPVLGWRRPHRGTDYAAKKGTPVLAVADGFVDFAGRDGGFGNVVRLRHDPHHTTLYGHLSRFARGLKAGKKVEQGEVVGYVGATGLATGPHLHFQIERKGRWVDFLKLELPFASPVPDAKRRAFVRRRDEALRMLGAAGPTST